MGPAHDLFHSLNLDDSLEPDREDPAEEKLGVPNDSLDQLDWLPALGSPQIPARARNDGVLDRKLAEEKLAAASDSLDEFDDDVNRALDIRREIYDPQVPRKPRWQPSRRRIWSLKPPPLAASDGGARKCIHCLATDTPQWRTGPAGPGTLCNACGIRFKSGRLLPEYRPSTSPMFASHLHSNRHKKVLKLREQFEIEHD